MNAAASSGLAGADCQVCRGGGFAGGGERRGTDGRFLLTPVLSLGEREHRTQRWCKVRALGGFALGLMVAALFAVAGFAQPVSYFSYDASGNLTNIQPTGPSAPVILAQPHSLLLKPGRIGGFSVVAVGAPPLAFQWRLNGLAVPGATNDTVLFSSSALSDVGWYDVVVNNSFGVAVSASAYLSFDLDGDGMPDEWEKFYFGGTNALAGTDFDGDGVSNRDEYTDGTKPSDPTSVFPRLTLRVFQGSVAAVPNLPRYASGQSVVLTATPATGQSFLGWSGDASGMNNPTVLVMDRSKTVAAICGLPIGPAVEAPQSAWLPGGHAGWYGQTNVSHVGADAAQSGPITKGEESWVETTRLFGGIGKVTCWCRTSAGTNDFLKFMVNGVEQAAAISGESGWQQRSYFLPAGTATLRWTFSVATNSLAASPAAWLDEVAFSEVCSVTVAEAIDATGLSWASRGGAWCGQTSIAYDGVDAVQAGPLSTNAAAWLDTTKTMAADGIMRFWWKLASGARADWLRCSVNGVDQAVISGNADWEERSLYLSAGTNVLRWTYARGSAGGGTPVTTLEGAWLDQLSVVVYYDPLWDLDGDSHPDLTEFVFRGGAGDGHDFAADLDRLVSGPGLAAEAFTGNVGDGHDFAAFQDFRPDGSALVASAFIGGAGDGHDAMAFQDFQADGGVLLASAFAGGVGDGFDSNAYQDAAPNGFTMATEAYVGGVGDGHDLGQILDFVPGGFYGMGMLAEEVFKGGSGDGRDSAAANDFYILWVVGQTNGMVLVWPSPGNLYVGQPLTARELSARANIPGLFLYDPPVGTVLPLGNHQALTLLFVPTDLLNYAPVWVNNWVNVVDFELNSIGVSGTNQVSFTYVCNTNSVVWASTNLVDWVSVKTNITTIPAVFEYRETDTRLYPRRFYRVVMP